MANSLVTANEQYLGKRNSPDAELLADVFIHLTRGQDVLLMDDSAANEASGNLSVVWFLARRMGQV